MDKIDSDWLRKHLPDEPRIKSRLAAHLKITPDKISKVLANTRRIQPQEIPLVLDFMRREVFSNPDSEAGKKRTQADNEARGRPHRQTADDQDSHANGLSEFESPPFDATHLADRSPDHVLLPLRNAAISPAVYRIEHDMPGFLLASNDVVMVDISRHPIPGELAIVALRDENNGTSTWAVRRWLGEMVMSGDPTPSITALDSNGVNVQPRGVVVAVARVMAPTA